MNCKRCDKPIDQHQAGPETDACVAELVFGSRGNFVVPHYSTNIVDAWEIVEKLNSSGHIVEIINDCVAWSVQFINIDTDKKYTSDWKCSLETQICRAALEALSR